MTSSRTSRRLSVPPMKLRQNTSGSESIRIELVSGPARFVSCAPPCKPAGDHGPSSEGQHCPSARSDQDVYPAQRASGGIDDGGIGLSQIQGVYLAPCAWPRPCG